MNHDLILDSVNEDRSDKMLRQSRKLRNILEVDVLAFGSLVSGPKGMHRKTFNRLRGELACVEQGMAT